MTGKRMDPRQQGFRLSQFDSLFETVELVERPAPEPPEVPEATESDWGEFVAATEASFTA